tara:strand:- start:5156 stop:5575 length:420 start_codon:yes stop_codon:yes gene_type:complete
VSTVYLGRLYRFNAGHRLSRPDRDSDWNLEVFGKCSYEGGHGHNYDLEVVISGTPDPLTGRLISLELLDTIVNEKVIEPIDHRNLNEVLETGSTPPPTTEVLIRDIWNRLADSIPSPAELKLLRILETEKNLFEYSGPA